MESVFSIFQAKGDLWTKATAPTSEILHSGLLANSLNETPKAYHLTAYKLYQCSPGPSPTYELESDLRWASLVLIPSPKPCEPSVGFSILSSSSQSSFYPPSPSDLSPWLHHLFRICILRDIDNYYSLSRELGSGGQSVVYLGISKADSKRVAVKCVPKSLILTHPHRLSILSREIGILRELRHPRVVQLYEVYEDWEGVYLVMEYIEGEELFASLCEKGKLTGEERDRFVGNLLDVLEFLQQKKVLHRDLKPENLMLSNPSDRSDFKLIDFGFAIHHSDKDITEACGSPGYIAPEILIKQCHGATVDLYSAGVLVFVVIGGYSPFYSKDLGEMVAKNARSEISFGRKWEGVEHKYVQLIKAMASPSPSQRRPIPYLRSILSSSPLSPSVHAESSPQFLPTPVSLQHLI